MTRIRTFVLVAATVALGFVLLPAGTAQADGEITALGWWTRSPTASAPEGGFVVGSSVDDDISVAAIQIDLGDGLSALTLTATEAGGAPELAGIRACPATPGWAPADGDPLEDAPEIDCTSSVKLARGDDGTWTADLTRLVAGQTGIVSIGIRANGPSGDGPLATPSEVQFEAPAVTGTPSLASPPTTSAGPFSPSAPVTSAPSRPTPPSSFTPPAPSSFTSPPTTALDTSTVDTGEVAVGPEETTPTTAAFTEERALGTVTAADVGGGGERPIGEAFFLVLLAALAGLAVGGVSKVRTMRAV